jgi:hypothetical protein
MELFDCERFIHPKTQQDESMWLGFMHASSEEFPDGFWCVIHEHEGEYYLENTGYDSALFNHYTVDALQNGFHRVNYHKIINPKYLLYFRLSN